MGNKADKELQQRFDSLQAIPSQEDIINRAEQTQTLGRELWAAKNIDKLDEPEQLMTQLQEITAIEKMGPKSQAEPLSDNEQVNQIVKQAFADAAREKQMEKDMQKIDQGDAAMKAGWAKQAAANPTPQAAPKDASDNAKPANSEQNYTQQNDWSNLKANPQNEVTSPKTPAAYPDLQAPTFKAQEVTTAPMGSFTGPEQPKTSSSPNKPDSSAHHNSNLDHKHSSPANNNNDHKDSNNTSTNKQTPSPPKNQPQSETSSNNENIKKDFSKSNTVNASQTQTNENHVTQKTGTSQRPPSFASAKSNNNASKEETKLSSNELTMAEGASTLGKVTMGIGAAATIATAGAAFPMILIGALISWAANSVAKIEKAELAQGVLQKHKNGEQVNDNLLHEAQSVARSTMNP